MAIAAKMPTIKPQGKNIMKNLNFIETQTEHDGHTNYLYTAKTPIGRFTVLDRMTGFGWRGIESGYQDLNGNFYLIEGEDIREREETPEQLAEIIKTKYRR